MTDFIPPPPDTVEVVEPTVTSNAIVLVGMIMGSVKEFYSTKEIVAEDGVVILQHNVTGNVYRVQVEQVGGFE